MGRRRRVSINSTSEEVLLDILQQNPHDYSWQFPLIPLPRKCCWNDVLQPPNFQPTLPLIPLPRKCCWYVITDPGLDPDYFPLIPLPRKCCWNKGEKVYNLKIDCFPLIPLPRKCCWNPTLSVQAQALVVSINSTSEEVLLVICAPNSHGYQIRFH